MSLETVKALPGCGKYEALLAGRPSLVLEDLPHDDYLALEAYSASGAKVLARSPAHFLTARTTRKEPTAAMVLGTAVHMAILEPARFAQYVRASTKPPGKREKDAEKEARQAEEARLTAEGYLILSQEQLDTALAIQAAAAAHPTLPELIGGQPVEVSMLYRDPRYGIPVKVRYDVLRADAIAVDLKTTGDASPEAFGRACATWRYDVQAALYNSAHEVARDSSLQAFVFAAIETEPPYGIGIYKTPAAVIRRGMSDVERTMQRYREALLRGEWPSYSPLIDDLQFPAWALKEPAFYRP